jgi:hypothetical protein
VDFSLSGKTIDKTSIHLFFFSFGLKSFSMTEIATNSANDIQQNLSSEIINLSSDIVQLVSETDNSTSESGDIEEPPSKKLKIISNDKSRLLEDRIGSILSCCICLDLSTLPMFQVGII